MIEIEHLDYNEDKVINGVLHYRDGCEWKEYCKRELTQMYMIERNALERHIDRELEEEGFSSDVY